jgi:hypothetical protein
VTSDSLRCRRYLSVLRLGDSIEYSGLDEARVVERGPCLAFFYDAFPPQAPGNMLPFRMPTMHVSLRPWLPWQQSIRVFVCLEAESSLPQRAGKACDNPVCRHLDPPGYPKLLLDSSHRELAAARRLSSRCRLHQSLKLLHVDHSMRRGGSVMSGVSPRLRSLRQRPGG